MKLVDLYQTTINLPDYGPRFLHNNRIWTDPRLLMEMYRYLWGNFLPSIFAWFSLIWYYKYACSFHAFEVVFPYYQSCLHGKLILINKPDSRAEKFSKITYNDNDLFQCLMSKIVKIMFSYLPHWKQTPIKLNLLFCSSSDLEIQTVNVTHRIPCCLKPDTIVSLDTSSCKFLRV